MKVEMEMIKKNVKWNSVTKPKKNHAIRVKWIFELNIMQMAPSTNTKQSL